jgi:hypothetical protein
MCGWVGRFCAKTVAKKRPRSQLQAAGNCSTVLFHYFSSKEERSDAKKKHHGDAAVWSEHGGGCDPGVMRTHRCLVGQWSHARCGEFGIRGHAVCLVRVQQAICMSQLPAHMHTDQLPCCCSHTRTAPIGMPLHVRVRMETIERIRAHVAVGLCACAWSWSWTSCQLDSRAACRFEGHAPQS